MANQPCKVYSLTKQNNIMRTQILTPWFACESMQERDLFAKFLKANGIDIEMTDGESVQLAGNNWTASLLKNIEDDFDKYCTTFHEDILIAEFIKLSTIVAMYHASREALAEHIGKYFEQNNDSRKEDDYFEVLTDFFQYTIYCEGRGDEYERNIYISNHVDCFPVGGCCNGEATITLDKNGNLEVDYNPL